MSGLRIVADQIYAIKILWVKKLTYIGATFTGPLVQLVDLGITLG